MAECRRLSRSDVESYYARGKRLSSALCTAQELSRFTGDVGQIMELIHPDVMARYYGCGLVAPDMLRGLDVLDLGCGVGVDCFVLSRLVGPAGHVMGVDMTQEQLDVANKYRLFHSNRFGYKRPNTLFIRGHVEDLAAAGFMDRSKDVIVSNCVLSLSMDKKAVFAESARVLKHGGELYFSDMYCSKEVPESIKSDKILCNEGFGGAMTFAKLCEYAESAGFCEPIMYETEQLNYNDDAIFERIPEDLKFKAVTFRLFKKPAQRVDKDKKMILTYFGGIKNTFMQLCLTSKIHLNRGESMLVGQPLAEALKASRYSRFLGFSEVKSDSDIADMPVLECVDPFLVEDSVSNGSNEETEDPFTCLGDAFSVKCILEEPVQEVEEEKDM